MIDGEPYIVLEYNFLRMQQRRPTSQTKLKNLITGKIITRTFQQSDSFPEAEIDKQPIIFLYSSRGEYWFRDKNDPKIRFMLKEENLGESGKFLKPNTDVLAYKFGEKILNIELPIKMDYLVKEAPPSYKGDTATGGSKIVVLENGLTMNVPMFINEGDVIRINTESGEYTERVEKK